jgi:hypothetical protein
LSGQACSKLVRCCSCKISFLISNDVNQQCLRISEAVQTGITVAGNQVHLVQTTTLHSFRI